MEARSSKLFGIWAGFGIDNFFENILAIDTNRGLAAADIISIDMQPRPGGRGIISIDTANRSGGAPPLHPTTGPHSPTALRGVSSWPCSRLSAFQNVSPWRTRNSQVWPAASVVMLSGSMSNKIFPLEVLGVGL